MAYTSVVATHSSPGIRSGTRSDAREKIVCRAIRLWNAHIPIFSVLECAKIQYGGCVMFATVMDLKC